MRRFVRRYEHTEEPAVRTAYGNLAGAVGIVCNALLCAAKPVSYTHLDVYKRQGPLFDENFRRAGANALRRTCNDGNLAFQTIHAYNFLSEW